MKLKVLISYYDKAEKRKVKEDEIIEVTDERYKELDKKLQQRYNLKFFEEYIPEVKNAPKTVKKVV